MKIGVWGDSITYGECDSEALGWVGRLRKSLVTMDGTKVYNFGVCGDTSEDVLKRFKIEAEGVEPEVVVFAIGLNDTKYQGNSDINLIPTVLYIANMRELLLQARVFTDKIFIIGLTYVDETWRSNSGSHFSNVIVANYNLQLEKLAQEMDVPFINVSKVVDLTVDLADSLHPSANGYQKLFEVIRNKVL